MLLLLLLVTVAVQVSSLMMCRNVRTVCHSLLTSRRRSCRVHSTSPSSASCSLVRRRTSDPPASPSSLVRFGVFHSWLRACSTHCVQRASSHVDVVLCALGCVAVRDDLLGRAVRSTPSVFDYSIMAKTDSLLNTPSVFSIYMVSLTLRWLADVGGIKCKTLAATALPTPIH